MCVDTLCVKIETHIYRMNLFRVNINDNVTIRQVFNYEQDTGCPNGSMDATLHVLTRL